ncbi:MAG: hypothetical protein IT435_03980 [Phycisphaerales bacterium]|nr:hypothetical protein [Phycisphaerales bacterium]
MTAAKNHIATGGAKERTEIMQEFNHRATVSGALRHACEKAAARRMIQSRGSQADDCLEKACRRLWTASKHQGTTGTPQRPIANLHRRIATAVVREAFDPRMIGAI